MTWNYCHNEKTKISSTTVYPSYWKQINVLGDSTALQITLQNETTRELHFLFKTNMDVKTENGMGGKQRKKSWR